MAIDGFAWKPSFAANTGEDMAVLKKRGHQVRIGIGASRRFDVLRREVLERKLAAETPDRRP